MTTTCLAPTALVYYQQPRTTQISARVQHVGIDEKYGVYVCLDQTIAYVHGGGQKGDRGIIEWREDAAAPAQFIEVTDTRKNGDLVMHILGHCSEEELARIQAQLSGKSVLMSIDWSFRYHQMRIHTMAHLLHCVTEQVLGKVLPVPQSSDLQAECGINRYAMAEPEILAAQQKIEQRMREYIAQGYDVTTYPSQDNPDYRYWHCGDFTVPCGGLHVANTREIGEFELKVKIKKGKTSMTFSVA